MRGESVLPWRDLIDLINLTQLYDDAMNRLLDGRVVFIQS